jgi:hypothetical protein
VQLPVTPSQLALQQSPSPRHEEPPGKHVVLQLEKLTSQYVPPQQSPSLAHDIPGAPHEPEPLLLDAPLLAPLQTVTAPLWQVVWLGTMHAFALSHHWHPSAVPNMVQFKQSESLEQ